MLEYHTGGEKQQQSNLSAPRKLGILVPAWPLPTWNAIDLGMPTSGRHSTNLDPNLCLLAGPSLPFCRTMRCGSTAKVLAKCMLQYYRISEGAGQGPVGNTNVLPWDQKIASPTLTPPTAALAAAKWLQVQLDEGPLPASCNDHHARHSLPDC